MTAHQDTQSGVLRLPEVLDMKAAGPLLGDLLKAVGQDLILDASDVRRIGGQCLQVLLSARASWAGEGFALRIADPSPDLLDGLALMGCADLAETQPVQD